MKGLDGGRIGIAAQSLGVAQAAFDAALAYARERETFGRPIAQHQAIGFKLAEMASRIKAAELLTLEAAWKADQGTMTDMDAAIAKLKSSNQDLRGEARELETRVGGYKSEIQRYIAALK